MPQSLDSAPPQWIDTSVSSQTRACVVVTFAVAVIHSMQWLCLRCSQCVTSQLANRHHCLVWLSLENTDAPGLSVYAWEHHKRISGNSVLLQRARSMTEVVTRLQSWPDQTTGCHTSRHGPSPLFPIIFQAVFPMLQSTFSKNVKSADLRAATDPLKNVRMVIIRKLWKWNNVVCVAGYYQNQFSGVVRRVRVNDEAINLRDLTTHENVDVVRCSSSQVEEFIAVMEQQQDYFYNYGHGPLAWN